MGKSKPLEADRSGDTTSDGKVGTRTSDVTDKTNEHFKTKERNEFTPGIIIPVPFDIRQRRLNGNKNGFKSENVDCGLNVLCKYKMKMKMNMKRVSIGNLYKKVTSRSAIILFLLLRIIMNVNVLIKKWTLVLVFLSYACALKEQKFAIEPQDQTAVIGSRVTLPCRVENKVGQLQWTKDDFGLGTHRHLTGYERYKMIGSDEEGDYSLDIKEVVMDDDALYQCQVSSGPRGEPPIRSRYARLRVLVPPEHPKILKGPVLQVLEDQELDLQCISVGGKPAAEITWVDNDGGVLTQDVTYTAEPLPDGRRFTARSILRLRPRRHHHNQTFTCQAQNTADRTYKAATVVLEVQYPPNVKMNIKSGLSNGMIHEGNTISLGCQASANPNNLTFKWYLNNKEVTGSSGNTLVITNVTRDLNDATVKCEVHNSVGKSADTRTLEVSYGPYFKQRPLNVEGDVGTTVTLTCEVDGHPKPKVNWLRYENERFIRAGKSPNLTVTVSEESAGLYWCRATNDNHQDIEAAATVYLRGPPKLMSNQTQFGVEGDIVRIECVSFSVPKPDFVIWMFDGIEINSFHNNEYAFLEESLSDRMTKSTLVIRESQARHFGMYNCSVTNIYGTDSLEIQLVPEKTFPIIIIATGCASTVIFFLFIMLIIMLCHRKTRNDDVKKPDITDITKTCVDQYKDSDRNSHISDLKLELRQVEGSCDFDNSNGSEAELHSSIHLTTNLGLPLAGPVQLPESGYNNELMKQYQRYSGDFHQAINHLNHKVHGQSNGYVPYVDYSRDYAPPGDSLTGSLTRNSESTFQSHCGSLHRQASCGRLGGLIGPDVIPMGNPGVTINGGVDVRYAATYGNPYLRGSGPLSYVPQISPVNTTKTGPPPYYSVRGSALNLPATSGTSPSSTSSSRPVTSPVASSSSTTSGAQPQVPRSSPHAGALYVLPHVPHGSLQSTQITAKGNGSQLKTGAHV